MIILIYFGIIVLSCTQSAMVKLNNRKSDQAFAFNEWKALSACIMFFLMCLGKFQFHLPTIIYGLAFAVFLCVSMQTGYRALCLGPMSLTSLIVGFSLIIPSAYGILFRGESLSIWKGIGFLLLFTAIILSNINKKSDHTEMEGHFRKWIFYVALTFISNGACSIVQKEHQTHYHGMYLTTFMLVAMLAASIIFSIPLCKRIGLKGLKNVSEIKYGAIAGLSNGGANYLTLALAGFENASVLFPVISAGTITASLLCGRVLFREKQNIYQKLAFLLGICSVILIKL